MQLRKPFTLFTPLLLLLVLVFCTSQQSTVEYTRLTSFVDPFIGTGGHGHTYPGATLPFGMVQLSPDNGTHGWDWSSGYNYSDSVISGFSHTHLSGTGIGDLCDISVMPSVNHSSDTAKIRALFSHANEKASPGYYSVLLQDENINVELTATKRAGFHRYTFPASNQAMIRFDLGTALNWDWSLKSSFRQLNDSTYIGYRHSSGWAPNQKVFFAVRLNKKPSSTKLYSDEKPADGVSAEGKSVKACLNFKTINKEEILMKVGLSMASEDGALKSLQEIPSWDFNAVKDEADKIWESELSKISIESDDTTVKRIFYTSLYHTYLAPTLFSDGNGHYRGANGKPDSARTDIYTTHSLWDTFRAANPLLTLTQPERIADIASSYLEFYDQHGLLPVWDLHFNETNTMTGYHAVPVLADAILKNIQGIDVQKAYEAMKKSSGQKIRATDQYINYGYVPHDKHVENVTITLEYAFDDWCIYRVAEKLGYPEGAAIYKKRAQNYRNLFDHTTGFFRPRLTSGEWVTPFDPLRTEFQVNPYTEGNAWQHTFFTPHDIEGLTKLYGGKDLLITKLDTLFSLMDKMTGKPVADITGLIGQYAHGNEPSHHIAYMYSALGSPSKTAEKVRQIMSELYSDKPDGLSGNEDCGQMSAWYVFSALGFYPMNPASGEYVFGSPIVSSAVLKIKDNVTFKIAVRNQGSDTPYIQSIKLNGQPFDKLYITHDEITQGGLLEITMGSNPSAWTKTTLKLPYSMTPRP